MVSTPSRFAQPGRSASVVSLAVLAMAAGLALPCAASAQAAPAPVAQPAPAPAVAAVPEQTSAVATRIVVRGNQRIDQSTIASYLPIHPGDTVDEAVVDVAVRALFRTELFADVQINLEGSTLVVTVVENPVINQVVFEGNNSLSEDKLRDEVTVRPRGIFTRARVQTDVGRIIELYRRSGRISATVTPKIVQLEQNRVDLVFEIDEGGQTGVSDINILGNRAFSDRDVRDVMVTKTSRFWRFFSQNDNYDPDRLEYDREQISKFYRNRGYYDFRIISAVSELTPRQDNFAVTLTVDEGEKYNFGDIHVQTQNNLLNVEFLEALLQGVMHSGQLYEADKIQQATDALTFAAGSAGYAFVDIRPIYHANRETHTVDVTFDVREGQRVYVERIDIVGNTRTIDPVIRREVLLVEGDAYNQALVDRSRQSLRALGFFKDVTVSDAQGSAADRSIVTVNVEEQPTGELSLGAGFSSVDSFVIDVGITERNFRGRGQNLVARLSWGSLRQQLDFRFTEPHFLGRDLSAGIDLFHYRYDFQSESSFDWQSTGAGLRLSWPLNGYSRVSTRYNIKSDDIIVPEFYCSPGAGGSAALCDQIGSSLNSAAGFTLLIDRRNDPVHPTRGWTGRFDQDFAGVGGDTHYIRSEASGTWYHGFIPSLVLSIEGAAGYIGGWNGDAIRINDRFFKGGNTFRGFETAGMGPRDILTNDALGGNAYAIGTVELTVPNFLPDEYGVKTSLFADFGTLGLLDDRYKLTTAGLRDTNIVDSLSLRASAGLSIHWRSPMGPIRFDLSQVLAHEDYDKTETFRFSTSTQF